MLVRRVVVQGRGVAKSGQRTDQQIAFGRMQVAARRIATQRPASGVDLLPRGNRQRVLEESRERADGKRNARHQTATVQLAVSGRQRFVVGAKQGQVNQRRALVAAKRIWLVYPIELRGAVGISVELVLGPL